MENWANELPFVAITISDKNGKIIEMNERSVMTFQKSNLIHATVSIFISLWMYYDSMNKDFGLLIPFLFGVVLLSLNNGIILDNIQQRNAALGVTLLLLVFIVYMIFDFARHDDVELTAWFGVMACTSFLSIVVFLWAKMKKSY